MIQVTNKPDLDELLKRKLITKSTYNIGNKLIMRGKALLLKVVRT